MLLTVLVSIDLPLVIVGSTNEDIYFADVSPSKSLLWGPGLQPDIVVLPCRYFFIQLVDQGGGNLTTAGQETGRRPVVTVAGDDGEVQMQGAFGQLDSIEMLPGTLSLLHLTARCQP